ncbi:FliM/FliN family flagellar motor C-terminal domain-containing protein [uncultured Microbulbifer sp.]|uniref:FliM/FliN family flagellar motor C-terminal domain-containing protein n=1 Tax=uncultured Microbulbifer sp. TaxID=348147 RepID=UPI002617B26A|nr:FliM/FliN family flagellar motor C-terminal domain-containing protein [uncultured Microbulbifer sp.]
MSFENEIDVLEPSEMNESNGKKLFEQINPKFLKGIEVEVKVELGNTSISFEKLATLSAGNIIQLDTPTDQYVNLTVADEVFAKGILVVVNGYYGVKIEEVFKG